MSGPRERYRRSLGGGHRQMSCGARELEDTTGRVEVPSLLSVT
ncbi:hypothetical protein [Saccharopolyspora sp. NPDC049426]